MDVSTRAAALRRGEITLSGLPGLVDGCCTSRDLVLAAVEHNGLALEFASQELRADRSLALTAVRQCYGALRFVSPTLLEDHELVLAALRHACGADALSVAKILRRDLAFMLTAVSVNPYVMIRVYSDEHTIDTVGELMLAALSVDADVIYACGGLLEKTGLYVDRAFMVQVAKVTKPKTAWLHASCKLHKDVEFAKDIVDLNGNALKYADKFQDNAAVVMLAVRQCGDALQYASPLMRANREIALAAVAKNGTAILCVDHALLHDREIILAAVTQDASIVAALAELAEYVEQLNRLKRLNNTIYDWRRDRAIMLAAVKQHWSAIKYASPELRVDREIVLAAVTRGWRAIKHASDAALTDRDIVLAAVAQNGYVLMHVGAALRVDDEIIRVACDQINRDD